MAWGIEFAPNAVSDLDSAYDHTFAYARDALGQSIADAASFARRRTESTVLGAERIAKAPHIGTVHQIEGWAFRHVTLDRAIYWFTLDEAARIVRIEGIFHGGQDHFGRMMQRLTQGGTG